MTAGRGLFLALGLAAMAASLLGTLAVTGKSPGGAMLERFEPHGIVSASPAEITRVELRAGADRFAFRRGRGGRWRSGTEGEAGLSDDLAEHLETALRFLHVSTPTRIIHVSEGAASLTDFGLEPPAYAVSLGAAGEPAAADFGALNPAQTSQYVHLVGDPSVYLLPRHVGAEWRLVADLARRSLPRAGAARPLLGVSMDEVWAVEIALGGTLHRFERDRFGQWFLHVGQHVHAAGDPGHLADPAKAPIIAAAFATLGEATVETVRASPTDADARFGLDRPELILLFYPRDSSTPLARLDVGARAENGFSRYVRSSPSEEVVAVAADAPERLVDLLHAVGALP